VLVEVGQWCCVGVGCACAFALFARVRMCVYVESEGKEEGGWKERRKRKEKKVKKGQSHQTRSLWGPGCVLLLLVCLFFLGEAGRAFSLKKIGAPARRAARGECTREREVVFSFSSF